MDKQTNVDRFLRNIEDRFAAFNAALGQLTLVMSLEDRAAKMKASQDVIDAIRNLKASMSDRDVPSWVGPLDRQLLSYLNNNAQHRNAGQALLNTIANLSAAISSQKWDFDEGHPIDFDGIYSEFFKHSRVPELFDQLVTQLQKIVDSGLIDSVTILKSLEQLIATIKKNSRGDFFSTTGAWQFASLYLKKFVTEVAESYPAVKVFVKPLRETIKELNVEMGNVHGGVGQKVLDVAKTSLPMLEYKPLALPAPAEDELD